MTPTRSFDSRDPSDWWEGHPLEAGGDVFDAIPIKGYAGVPADDEVGAVVLNLTATDATDDTFITLWAKGSQPATTNLNVRAGDTVANLAIVPIADNNFHLRMSNAVGSVHVVVDVLGYFSLEKGQRYHAIEPTRILDGRNGTGLSGPWGPRQRRDLEMTPTPIPSGASAIVATITVTGSTEPSLVSAYGAGVPRPTSSTVNFSTGQTVANATYLGFPVGNTLSIYNALGSVDVIADVTGYFTRT
jgi:hypothetical protein